MIPEMERLKLTGHCYCNDNQELLSFTRVSKCLHGTVLILGLMLGYSDHWVIVGKFSDSFRTVVMTSVQEYAGMSHFG